MNRTASCRHPLRRGLASLSVLTLSTAGLAVGLAPAAHAEVDPAQRYYSYLSTAGAMDVNFMSDSSDVNLRFGYVQNHGQLDDGSPYAQHWATGSNTDAYGRYPDADTASLTSWASVLASTDVENEDWQPHLASSPGGAIAGAFSIGQSDSMAFARAGVDQYHCVGEGEILSESSSTTRDVDLAELTYGGDVVDVANLDGQVTTRSETRMVSNGGEHTRGLRTVVEGAAGSYSFNDGSLTVNVVRGAKIVGLADGVNPTTAVLTPAVVEATDADGVTTPLAPGSSTTFANPDNPRVSVTVQVPAGPTNEDATPDGTEMSSSTNAFRADLNVQGHDSMGSDFAEVGRVMVSATVPVGGVDCTPRATPPPATRVDSDRDGLTDAREARIGTNPDKADTDGDRLKDGVEVNGITTRRLDDVRTNPLKADTDGDRLKDGVEVRGFRNRRFDHTFRSHPRKVDTDRDGLRDRVEVTGSANGKFRNEPTNPYRRDTDRGGVLDKRELRLGSNPADIHSGPSNP